MGLAFILDEDTRARDLWNAILSHNATHPAESIDVVRVGDADGPPCGTPDPELIAWACEHGRIIVSHDKNTLINCHDRVVEGGHTTPGLLIVQRGYSVPKLVELLSLVGNYGEPDEFNSRTQWVP